MAARVANGQQYQVRHEAIDVPSHSNSFNNEASEEQFWHIVHEVVEQDITLQDVGLLSDEWDDGSYPSFETLRVGNRGTKEIYILLEDSVWFCWAKWWGQALTVLKMSQLN